MHRRSQLGKEEKRKTGAPDSETDMPGPCWSSALLLVRLVIQLLPHKNFE